MENKQLKLVHIYADGCCLGNPGGGGWGCLLIYLSNLREYRKEIYGGFLKSTNNRMELTAVIQGLRTLKQKCSVVVHTDSQYITSAFNEGWLEKWQARNWKNVKNIDLWKELLNLYKQHEVCFQWIRGHNGHPEQERSDFLANQGVKVTNLLIDFGYEQELAKQNAQGSFLSA